MSAIDATCWSEADRARMIDDILSELWRHLASRARLLAPGDRVTADLLGVSEAALTMLSHLHLVLCDEVDLFVARALPALLDAVRPTTVPEAATQRVAIRGRVDWGRTAARRASGGYDRTVFVTALPQTTVEKAQTRLLLRLLRGLRRSCRALRRAAPLTAPEGWTVTLRRIESAVDEALAHPVLARMRVDSERGDADLVSCRRSPSAATGLLVAAYTAYHDLVVAPRPEALCEALQRRVLLPLDDDALYELWALVGAVGALGEDGWTVEHSSLIRQVAAPFTMRSPDGLSTATFLFGHTPAAWRRASRYRALFTRYGVAGALRRPDLIVEIGSESRRRYLMVEVKLTRDPQYIADSIYKVLGYMADFEPALSDASDAAALLLIWDGMAETFVEPVDRVAIATHNDYHATLRVLLARLGS